MSPDLTTAIYHSGLDTDKRLDKSWFPLSDQNAGSTPEHETVRASGKWPTVSVGRHDTWSIFVLKYFKHTCAYLRVSQALT